MDEDIPGRSREKSLSPRAAPPHACPWMNTNPDPRLTPFFRSVASRNCALRAAGRQGANAGQVPLELGEVLAMEGGGGKRWQDPRPCPPTHPATISPAAWRVQIGPRRQTRSSGKRRPGGCVSLCPGAFVLNSAGCIYVCEALGVFRSEILYKYWKCLGIVHTHWWRVRYDYPSVWCVCVCACVRARERESTHACLLWNQG